METLADLQIPSEHWANTPPHARNFIPAWESHLRKNVLARPDPAERFSHWLETKAKGDFTPSARLIFLEQPYLRWAEAIEQAFKTAEKQLRAQIAYEVENPERD